MTLSPLARRVRALMHRRPKEAGDGRQRLVLLASPAAWYAIRSGVALRKGR